MIRTAALLALVVGSVLVAADPPPPITRTETIPKATFAEDFGLVLPGQVLTVTVVAAPGYALDSGEVDKASGWTGAPYTWTYTVPASYAGSHVASFKGKYHQLGGEGKGGELLDWSGTATSKGISVTIGDVVRGEGLPPSIPPGKTRDVQVTVDPAQLPSGHTIVLSVDNSGDKDAGTATISAPEGGSITGSATITIKGGEQTKPKHSGKLVIVARLDSATGAELARSNGFSVCAHIENFHLNGKKSDWLGGRYGMVVKLDWASDDAANTRALLDRCFWMEKVTPGARDNPPWTPGGLQVQTQPVKGSAPGGEDNHSILRANLQGKPPTAAGHVVFDQQYDFYCERCGMTKDGMVKIPGADFRIDHSCEANAAGEYHVVTVKTGPGGPVSSINQYQWAPIAPTDVAGTVNVDPAKPDQYTVTVTWNDRSDIEQDYVASFQVEGFQAIVSAAQPKDSATWTSKAYTITTQKGLPVTLKVRARNEFGASPEATATITFPE